VKSTLAESHEAISPEYQLYVPYGTKLCCLLLEEESKLFGMNPKIEELLYLLLWTSDQLFRPTFRNLTDSYEAWAYRNGLLRELARLEQRQLVESEEGPADERVHRLTAQGRLHALGGRDPEARWARRWDGRWRLAVFDVPVGQDAQRKRLVRYLRDRAFGYLQKSVWVSPDPLSDERGILAGSTVDVESLILFEGRPCAGESDQEIVAAAWNFERINRRYQACLEVLSARPSSPVTGDAAARAFRRWAAEERLTWLAAVSEDPLLPECLSPAGYLGARTWQARKGVLGKAAEQLRQAQP
jgi:DNA-binding transcriptional regulator PaaX